MNRQSNYAVWRSVIRKLTNRSVKLFKNAAVMEKGRDNELKIYLKSSDFCSELVYKTRRDLSVSNSVYRLA